MVLRAEEQVAAFQRAVAESAAGADDLELMRQAIQAIEVRRSSPDRAVTVVAGPGGSVRSITFADHALGQSAQALSRLTTSTLRQAVAEAARSQADIVQRYAGEHIDISGRVTLLQDELFAEPAAEGFPPHRAPAEPDGVLAAANDRAAWTEPRPPQRFTPPPQPQHHQPPQPQHQPQHQPRSRPRVEEAEPDGYTLRMDED
jgi:DNA-binding protein YbaB